MELQSVPCPLLAIGLSLRPNLDYLSNAQCKIDRLVSFIGWIKNLPVGQCTFVMYRNGFPLFGFGSTSFWMIFITQSTIRLFKTSSQFFHFGLCCSLLFGNTLFPCPFERTKSFNGVPFLASSPTLTISKVSMVSPWAMASTTCWPSSTRPNTVCLLSNQGVAKWVIKTGSHWSPVLHWPWTTLQDHRAPNRDGTHHRTYNPSPVPVPVGHPLEP